MNSIFEQDQTYLEALNLKVGHLQHYKSIRGILTNPNCFHDSGDKAYDAFDYVMKMFGLSKGESKVEMQDGLILRDMINMYYGPNTSFKSFYLPFGNLKEDAKRIVDAGFNEWIAKAEIAEPIIL